MSSTRFLLHNCAMGFAGVILLGSLWGGVAARP